MLRKTCLAVFLIVGFNALSAYSQTSQVSPEVNAMLQPWPGPYGGVPPWNLVRPEQFDAAFDAAIEMAIADINSIADQPASPTFENTLVRLETAGRALERLQNLFGVFQSNLNLGPIPDLERSITPKLAAYNDRVMQHAKLFARVESVYQSDAKNTLSVAQQRLLDDRYKQFVRSGAKLDADQKQRLSQINQRLASLFTRFSQNVLHDEQHHVTWVEKREELVGLADSFIASLAAEAKERGRDGAWAIANTRSAVEPVLTYADNRALREKVWRTFTRRGDNGDDYDNQTVISEILRLRAERAKMLGYATHAHWRLEPQMAKTPEATLQLMMQVWPKAVQRVHEEVAAMQALAQASGDQITIEPWDYRYYAEKVRKAKYDLDFNEVKPYLQLEKLREAMLWAAGELYGLQFQEIHDVPVFHQDVRVWEVKDADGKHVGLWYLDPYAREGKRSGAWMTAYRSQEDIAEPITAIVSNNSNFIKGAGDEPVLISWDDAKTLFHEFGHALHGLLSKVNYPSQSGTSVARDYVEFPSQLNEHWLQTPEVLNRFALHYQSGKPMPPELLAKIERTATFNEGFATVEYLSSALVDMHLHLAGDMELHPNLFERQTLEKLGMPKEMVMRHRTPHFSHIFSSDGYSAGYYSYLWSDALTADAAEVFKEAGTFYDPAIAKRLHDTVMSVGDTIDPAEGFRRFRGRDVDTGALLRKRGFAD